MAKKPEFTVEIKIVSLKELVHNDANPRDIDPQGHQDLVKSLREFPEMKKLREVVVDENMLILAGDKRTYALEELGYEDVEVKQVFGLPEKKKREFIAKDNNHNGFWNKDIIKNSWSIDELNSWGIKGISFGDEEDKPKKKTTASKSHDEVICPGCGLEFVPGEDEE